MDKINVFAMQSLDSKGNTITKYFDDSGDCIAVRGTDGELIPSQKYMYDNIGFLNELDKVNIQNIDSLDEIENSKDNGLEIPHNSKGKDEAKTKKEIEKKVEEEGIDKVSEGLSDEEKEQQNKLLLDFLNIKQEIPLDQKIDTKYTAAELLGEDSGSTLLVHDNGRSFDLFIKTADGELKSPENLERFRGTDSDVQTYEMNRDGSQVEKRQVQSTFEIKSPLVKNAIFNIRYGQMGKVEMSYGQKDKTDHLKAVTYTMEDPETHYVTREVRNEFDPKNGEYNISNKVDEIEEHNDCNLTLAEADGNLHTGHMHGEEAANIILADDEFVNETNDAFTHNDVAERFEHMREQNPSLDNDELIEITKEELLAERIHEGPLGRFL